jgi:hypothetical protein
MPRFETMLVAQNIVIDRGSNNMSIINVIDEVVVPKDVVEPEKGKYIAGAFPVMALGIWRRSNRAEPEIADARVRFFGPRSKEPLGTTEVKVDLSGTLTRKRTVVKFDAFPYVGVGIYRIEFQLKSGTKWLSTGSSEFTVRKAE